MWKHTMRLAALSCVFLIASCESAPKPIPTTEGSCRAVEAIPYHYDAKSPVCSTEAGASDPRNSCDTLETVRAIQAFNAGLAGLCKKGT